mgnify:CR=1 FL=1
MYPKNIAKLAISAMLEKKSEDVLLLKVGEVTDIADYFVIASCDTEIQARAVADAVEMKLKRKGLLPHHIEGYEYAHWILMDYVSVVIHIFQKPYRIYYGLERLWGDVPVEEFREE